jgi:hypothetical protein
METKELSAKVTAVTGTLLLAAATVAFLAIGCGEQKSKTTMQRAEANGVTSGVMETPNQAIPAVATAEGTTAEGATTGSETTTPQAEAGATQVDALPPDVAASVTEAIATRGGIVEILAEGSPDVTSVTLTDAIGKTYPFIYQPATDRWRVLYRVPLRAKTEQLGLGVTATNAANRYKRVWVFVDLGQDQCAAEADSGR